jgi:hypothetical protein
MWPQHPASPVSGAGWRGSLREDQITIMTDPLTQAAGTIRGVLDDLSALRVTTSRAERTAAILDRLATELAEAAALLRRMQARPPGQ